MKAIIILIVGACLVACGTPEDTATTGNDRPKATITPLGFKPFAFKIVDDNLHHDTLLTQVTFDMGDGTYLMVASNVEETFEGLRLYRYRFFGPDSVFEMMAISSPAYDSWTMLPTFFGTDSTDTHALWVLANLGEKESWGQKLLWLDWEFSDDGFMDVALPERVMEDDTLRLKRRSIASSVRYEQRSDTFYFRFACDSVYLYDDQAGHTDTVVPAGTVHFTYHRDEGLAMWVNGEKRLVKRPA